MKEAILQFIEEQVNPTYGEIIAKFGLETSKRTIEDGLYDSTLFRYWDITASYQGEYRICNDSNLF